MRIQVRKKTAKLAEGVIANLKAKLLNQELKTGDRLPTEHALMQTFGVSRTVVREAITVLRAEGLVYARQGSGVYVTELPEPTFGLLLPELQSANLSSVIEMLEIRAALESEAAALAAERHSSTQLVEVRDCYDNISLALDSGDWAEDQDFAFHLAVARATCNLHFVEILSIFGQRTIPRRQVYGKAVTSRWSRAYLERIQTEHLNIVEAIAARDGERARRCMRTHLKGSQRRYQELMDTLQNGRSDQDL